MIRLQTTARQVNLLNDARRRLRNQVSERLSGIELCGESAAVRKRCSRPERLADGKTKQAVSGVALVLADGKDDAGLQQLFRIIFQEEAAGNRRDGASDLIGIGGKAAESPPFRYVKLRFRTVNGGARKRRRQAHAGIEQQIVVNEVTRVAQKCLGIEPRMGRGQLGKTDFAEIATGEWHRELRGCTAQPQYRS